MKKILGIVLVIGVVLAILYFGKGLGLGFGSGMGFGEGDSNGAIQVSRNDMEIEDRETEEFTRELPKIEEQIEEVENEVVKKILAVTVVENDYFYENERIVLEDFIKELEKIEGELVVEVKDDNASLKAYRNLLDELEKSNVDYIEK